MLTPTPKRFLVVRINCNPTDTHASICEFDSELDGAFEDCLDMAIPGDTDIIEHRFVAAYDAGMARISQDCYRRDGWTRYER